MRSPLAGLNEEQREAALCDGHCLVTACPGSGKTRTLAAKAAYVLQTDANATVCAVTFTREAALEIRSRIVQLAGHGAKPRLVAGTFHSLCLLQSTSHRAEHEFGGAVLARMRVPQCALLERHGIATEGDRRGYVARAIDLAGLANLEEEEALRIVEIAKANVEPSDEGGRAPAVRLVQAYQDLLERNGKLDFQDLLLSAVRGMREGALQPYPVTHLLVDEFQDSDALQYEWVRFHAEAGVKVTVVADDDQSIYGWRLALGYAGLDRFARDAHARHVVLGVNYRSRAEILEAADRLVRHNARRIAKRLRAANGPGGSVRFGIFPDSEAEGSASADWCASWKARGESDLAVLARTNRRLDYAEAALAVRGVDYVRLGGGSIFDQQEVSVFADVLNLVAGSGSAGLDHVLAWAGVGEQDLRTLHRELGDRLLAPKRGELANLQIEREASGIFRELFARIRVWRELARRDKPALVVEGVKEWMCGRGKDEWRQRTIELAASVFGALDVPLGRRVTELRARRRGKSANGAQGVVLTTMHGAKGLEWERVWIVSAEQKVIPDDKGAIEEERRLMYVAMTRAKSELVVSASARRGPSLFVREAGLQIELQ